MVHAINVKTICLITLILFSEGSVFSAGDIATLNDNQLVFQITIVLLSVFFILSLVKNFKKTKQLALKEKELKKLEEQIKNLSEHLKAEEIRQKSQKSIIKTKEIFDEKNRIFLYSLASSDEKKIENALISLIPDVEKLILQTFEKGERFKIKELNIDLNKKKISSLEKTVLFEDFDETEKKIFFFPVKGGQQNVGAVIILLKKDADTSDLTISTMNTMASLLSTILIRKKYEKYTQDFQQNVIIALVNILELHDVNEKGHSERVAKTAVAISERMKLSQAEIIQTYWASMIHDIGKIIIFNCLCEALSSEFPDNTPGSQAYKELMAEMSADISYFIATEWQLPTIYCEVLEVQRAITRSPLAEQLYKGNLLSEVYLLYKKKQISDPLIEKLPGRDYALVDF
jgi:HD-GYP domain-containing protein (c-di-GMP phosphodiesterase class II)